MVAVSAALAWSWTPVAKVACTFALTAVLANRKRQSVFSRPAAMGTTSLFETAEPVSPNCLTVCQVVQRLNWSRRWW